MIVTLNLKLYFNEEERGRRGEIAIEIFFPAQFNPIRPFAQSSVIALPNIHCYRAAFIQCYVGT